MPLFETLDDLEHARRDGRFSRSGVRAAARRARQAAGSNDRYSDSSKDAGSSRVVGSISRQESYRIFFAMRASSSASFTAERSADGEAARRCIGRSPRFHLERPRTDQDPEQGEIISQQFVCSGRGAKRRVTAQESCSRSFRIGD